MANTIATAKGMDASRVKETHRLGSRAAEAVAATWVTHAEAYVNADGSGYVLVKRRHEILHRYEFGPE
jgi:hypothetical protein